MIGNKEEAYECFNLALKYMKVGNYSHAKNLLLKCKRMFPDIDISEKLKICEEELNKTEHIGKENEVHNNNNNSTFRNNQGNLHERHKTKDECLEKILRTNNYYEILGIPKNSNDETIKSAYKKLAKLYHPDKNKEKGAEEAFKKVSKAFQHLINKEKRYEYDNNSETDHHHQTFRTTHYYYNDETFTPEDLFRSFFGINFATCNNRQFRANVNTNRTYANTNNNSNNNSQRNYSFVQVSIFLIMFIIFFLSSHFEQPKAVYSLQKTGYFDTLNYTSLNNIRFFTKRSFNYNYPRNSHARFQIEYEVEYKYYEHECHILTKKIKNDYYKQKNQYQQKLNYQDIPESCMKLKTLEEQYNNFILKMKKR
ncbi:DnaJ protein, putative [Plasmodium malariae]|uniref:DnaJ protein, putative n=1 Tax=Plasmodium malariae TaxID=5858 RepID=A0A1A8W1I0_PLAMA|nr:DnaJ protein, putative [Plasmodium malariae]SBS85805.1 DnaJ protein, putative [Plasmodium malariae]SBT71467.1 DnaJ protein, putative [Plasmodium malariae]SCN12886.1 DnaJ protein, putative [Plasmodium malariae]